MESIRKWLYKPKRDDKSLLAQFFYADEDLNMVANELDSFDGRKDPERCTSLVNQLRQAQDKVLTITNAVMDALICDERADRDFRVKFPEDVLQDNLAGQLWFGAECLAAGSSIMNREAESTAMRPLAKAVTKSLENVRNLLRDACLRKNTPNGPIKLDSNELVTEMLLESLKIFDRLFAEFELAYVSAMVPVKTTQEYELQELIGVLFSETLRRALKMKLLTQEMVDDCDPALMFTIPRLAIVSGLLVFPNGPLYIDKPYEEMSEMFRPFRTLLHKIRELLWTLNKRELYMLEKLLCDNEEISDLKSVSDVGVQFDSDEFINQFYGDYSLCQDAVSDFLVPEREPCKRESVREFLLTNFDLDTPSTSGSLIPTSILHSTIIAANSGSNYHDSPPDHDSMEVISVAAATLSSILAQPKTKHKTGEPESPDDSGICTETTSLDRSPSLDEPSSCGCASKKPHAPPGLTLRKAAQRRSGFAASATPFVPGKTENAFSSRRNDEEGKGCPERRKEEDEEEEGEGSSSSSETSSFHSNCADDEEIAMAMRAAELVNRNDVRAKYTSGEDLLHRLFVCIAGVADQLQTNFACDLRNILKSVFLINATSDLAAKSLDTANSIEFPHDVIESLSTSIEFHPAAGDVIENDEFSVDPNILAQEAVFDTNVYFHLDGEECREGYSNHPRQAQEDGDSISNLSTELNRYASLREDIANLQSTYVAQTETPAADPYETPDYSRPPIWIPDVEAPKCMSCGANFTVVKRRHHCRNCGKVFCARCSSNSVPLPKFGHAKPVRVCNKCFIYNLTPFTM
ncbi:unnamed protein product [Phaedon cochleariae]|uniref:Lateral signaling target protein 2 homolog n=1 Tax=Phaedon cochleariae TaxID=80249 RepID=A0A9N9SBX4_PHACE|nr:unnamed protein product [Phaedon cochleariae]